ncbi:hypothetical protein DEJ13_07630 [Curtobacterium sp. MCLR17_007]|uniref:hypothetical protein n=1 Tax=Curtobacterium sp. MCLR17_007 TaxID=2175648 RepID=UPI000DA739B0|nr:hypothetical protein [Curtobacterium sp. MCLR17_007]WIB61690.1 hypothetical protein DEJ13_07630 [Curtobacterium sp. MCLR17_007]
MATRTDRREPARQKAADRREAQQRIRTRRLWLVGAAVVVVLAAVTAVTVTSLTRGDDTARTASGTSAAPPWPAPADAAARANAAGLEVAGMEGAALHTHQHLSVSVDGKPVAVPANIGVDVQQGGMSALHTHDTSGIVHVESAEVQPFTLGQLFTEWGVALRARQVGGYVDGRDGQEIAVFVDGEQTSTPLPRLRLEDQQDIAIVITRGVGTPIAPAPFDWSTAS